MVLFSTADYKRVFAFTSGHLGALPFSDNHLYDAISSSKFYCFLKQLTSLVFELLKFVVFSLLPLKNLARIFRTALRQFCNPNFVGENSFCVISLGNQSVDCDAYFPKLLSSQKENFDYLKIVGGGGFCSDKFTYVESALGYVSLIELVVKIFFLPFTSLFYSVRSCRIIKHYRARMIYLILCLKEINSGEVVNNIIIVRSIQCALANSVTKKILFPMEGRNWEKLIVGGLRNLGVEAVGYIHCSLTPRHLSLTNVGFYNLQEIPSLIITPSEMIFKTIQPVFPGARAKKGFFLRGDSFGAMESKSITCDCLLFALTGNIKESFKIIDCIKASGVDDSNKVILRLNKNAASYKVISKYAKNRGLTLFSNAQDCRPSICFFRSSSVALDYLKIDSTPVYLHLDEIITNNVFDLGAETLFQFQTLEVNNSFSTNLHEIIKLNRPIDIGIELSRYYLDSSFADTDLVGLLS